MNQDLKKEILKYLEITRETTKNNMEFSLCCYAETLSRLDLLTYFIMNDDKNSFKV